MRQRGKKLALMTLSRVHFTFKNAAPMASIASFTFNPFEENTYVVYDETGDAVVVDPGCYDPAEKDELKAFIADNSLKPVKLLNTHCHVDHVLGNRFISNEYAVPLEMHDKELGLLKLAPSLGKNYGVFIEESPQPKTLLDEGSIVKFGSTELKVLFTPGHSPGGICFLDETGNYIIVGDVLFKQSIGRYDFPNSNKEDLMNSLKRLMELPEDMKVYAGHGPATTIGDELKENPFLLELRAS